MNGPQENKYVHIQTKLRQDYPPRIMRWIISHCPLDPQFTIIIQALTFWEARYSRSWRLPTILNSYVCGGWRFFKHPPGTNLCDSQTTFTTTPGSPLHTSAVCFAIVLVRKSSIIVFYQIVYQAWSWFQNKFKAVSSHSLITNTCDLLKTSSLSEMLRTVYR